MRVLYIILFFSLAFFNNAFSQCENSVELIDIKEASALNNGVIEVKVKSSSQYRLQLIKYKSSKKQLVEEINSNGDNIYKFDKLTDDFIYRILVEFEDQNFLCSKLIIDDIVLKSE